MHEKPEKRQDVSQVELGQRLRVLACKADNEHSLNIHRDELSHLELREVFAPRRPNVEASQEVVEIHEKVDDRVRNNGIINVTVESTQRNKPVDRENGRMMIYVEERKLLVFSSSHNKKGIHEVKDLAQIEYPFNRRNSWGPHIERIAEEAVALLVRTNGCSTSHPGAQHDLNKIINNLKNFDWLALDAFIKRFFCLLFFLRGCVSDDPDDHEYGITSEYN